MLEKVISGLQCGADQAGLFAAEFVGIKTGGMAPKGYKTEKGFEPSVGKRFNVEESFSSNYKVRTEWNVKNSDATIAIATDFNSPGEKLTYNLTKKHDKPYLAITPEQNLEFVDEVVNWFNRENYKSEQLDLIFKPINNSSINVLNVAGNRESTSPGIFDWTFMFLVKLFTAIKEKEQRPSKHFRKFYD